MLRLLFFGWSSFNCSGLWLLDNGIKRFAIAAHAHLFAHLATLATLGNVLLFLLALLSFRC
ncbi:MAG: hypothetical protein WBH20_13355 [Oceanisphaera sp.]